ncbi:MAG: glk [Caulobacteraceae bacterium]|nr:glk [Caulobacteraceae bacterium]
MSSTATDGAETALVGDIGGTNARLALARIQAGKIELFSRQTFACAQYDGLEAVIETYFQQQSVKLRPARACIAAAGPVANGALAMTNLNWKISEAGIESTGVAKARLINDFQAFAYAAPALEAADLHPIGPHGRAKDSGSLVVLGPGTGLGVSALVRDRGEEVAEASEGGHIAFAPTDELEVEIWRWLTRRFGRVSAERLICGPGLANLYEALAEIDGVETSRLEAAEIVAQARAGEARALACICRFCGLLASFAGDLALIHLARGGVFIGGGMTPAMLDLIDPAAFRTRFEAKGRFTAMMSAIPTLVITRPDAALVGSAKVALQ